MLISSLYIEIDKVQSNICVNINDPVNISNLHCQARTKNFLRVAVLKCFLLKVRDLMKVRDLKLSCVSTS